MLEAPGSRHQTVQQMTSQIEQFAEAAAEFCDWAERTCAPIEKEAAVALALLSNLYQRALHLPDVSGEEEPGEVTQDAWARIYKRFGSLPFNFYSQCFNPLDSLDEPSGVADLADDLADIWRDLKRGLSLFDAGHISAAAWEWRQSFWQHWGRHAAGGIYALHCWLVDQPESAANDEAKSKSLPGSA